ncbi:MAG TPA: hypothetical protein VG273_21085 [Bryobacteraceae bacterium]|jgi:hypothetical protein|nr:hypothetical protein [Bryobacteraceae bacterium]
MSATWVLFPVFLVIGAAFLYIVIFKPIWDKEKDQDFKKRP